MKLFIDISFFSARAEAALAEDLARLPGVGWKKNKSPKKLDMVSKKNKFVEICRDHPRS